MYRLVLDSKPGWAPALRGLAAAQAAAGKTDEAAAHYAKAVAADPKDLEGRNGFALALAGQGKLEAAVAQYRESLKIDPRQVAVKCSLAALLGALNRPGEAIEEYRDAVRLEADSSEALNNLAWLLATCSEPSLRNGPEAVRLAEQACEQAKDSMPVFVGTLAAAYAEAGRFQDAIAAAEKARKLATTAGLKEVAQRNTELLELYQASQPYHTPPRAGRAP
jgi:tetratricopeptide (TPR) repeat protein